MQFIEVSFAFFEMLLNSIPQLIEYSLRNRLINRAPVYSRISACASDDESVGG